MFYIITFYLKTIKILGSYILNTHKSQFQYLH